MKGQSIVVLRHSDREMCGTCETNRTGWDGYFEDVDKPAACSDRSRALINDVSE